VDEDFPTYIARKLGRDRVPDAVPPPPAVDERVARLVATDGDLVGRFVATANAAKMHAEPIHEGELAGRLVAFAREHRLATLVVTRCELFDRLGVLPALRDAGIDAVAWDETTLDASYEADAGLTDVWAAVAETGSLVLRASTGHGRAASLVPAVHVAVVRRDQVVADLIDLMRHLDATEGGTAGGVILVTGPSKTADIEMNLVVGVHGPGEVYVFVV